MANRYLEQRKKLVWDSSQFTEVGNLHVVDDYKNYLYKDNFKAQTGAGDCTAQVLNGGYIGLRSYQGYQPVLINFTGDTPFRLNQLVWRNNPDQGNQGYAPTFYTLTASNDDWATSVTLGTFTASAAKDEAKTFTWDVNSTTAYKSYNMTSDGRHTYGSDGKYALSITFISFEADYDKDSYDKVNGVASGFSSGSYLTIPSIDMTQPWEGHIDFSTTTLGTASGYINWGSTSVDNGLVLSSSGWLSFRTVVGQINSDVLKDNTKYSCIIGWSGTQYYLKILEYGTNEWKTKTMNNTTANSAVDTTMKIGLFGSTFSCLGSLNLKTIKFYQNNTLVFDGGKQTYAYDPSKFTVVGSPTITEGGILSNCSSTDYVNTQVQLSQLAGKSWTVKGSISAGTDSSVAVKFSSTGYVTFGSIKYSATYRRIDFAGRTGISGDVNNEGDKIRTPNNSFAVGDKIYYTLSFDITTGTYSFYVDKVNGTTLIGTWTATTDNKELYYINTQPTQYISFGRGSDGVSNLTTGSVDMSDFSVEIEGEEIFTGTKSVHLLELRKEGFDLSKFTVVGSPTISEDGILSNCSNGNAVNTKVQLSQLAGKSWAVKGSAVVGDVNINLVKLSSVGNGVYNNFGSIWWHYTQKRIYFNARTGIAGDTNNEGGHITGSSVFEIGDKVYYTLTFDVTIGTYTLYADKVDGTTYQGKWTPATDNKELYYMNTHPEYYISLGTGSDNVHYLTAGSVDMKDFSVEVDGKEVFTGAKENYYMLKEESKNPYYCEVEYLETTGTQYINTGVPFHFSEDTVTLNAELTQLNQYQTVYGVNEIFDRSTQFFGVRQLATQEKWQGLGVSISFPTFTLNKQFTLQISRIDKTFFQYKGETVVTGSTNNLIDTTLNGFILSTNNNGSPAFNCIGKIYAYQHKRAGVLVRDLIPVLDWDMKPCMYDKVSGQLFYNAGTGDFLYGREIHEVEYLESTGTQYIDTGVYFNDTTHTYGWEIEAQAINTGYTLYKWFTGYNQNGVNSCGGYGDNATQYTFYPAGKYYQNGVVVAASTGGEKYERVKNIISLKNKICDNSIVLFARWVQTSNTIDAGGTKRIFNARYYDNDILVRDYIPAVDENGVGFMFDKVSHTIFDNAGTGSFIAGEIVGN